MLGKTKAEEIKKSWRDICPDFEGYMIEFLSGDIWARSGLDKRTKRLITIAALMAMGRSKGLELNIRMAANNGARERKLRSLHGLKRRRLKPRLFHFDRGSISRNGTSR
jgi:alkylhydroperoxidase/carboxymuconolactone decarboxylase family protein YurZ